MIGTVLLDLLVPPRCLACPATEHPLCAECRAALPWLRGERCSRCAMPAPHTGSPCPALDHAFDAAFAPMAHEGVARHLVHELKHRGRAPVADVLAAQLAATGPREFGLVVAVPPHRGRTRRSGIDHARLIARCYARRRGLRAARLLERTDGGRQAGTGRAQRLARSRSAYRATGTTRGTVLLVDDVHTTGATLDACARALKGAGAERVVALTYSRAL